MLVKCLVENTTCKDCVCAEHGLSLYIEVNGRKLLFDMGQTDLILKNAQSLNVNLADVDTVVLSHGHYDHGGGMRAFLSANNKAKIYMSSLAKGDYFNATEKYIGLSKDYNFDSRTVPVFDKMSLGDGLTIYSCNGRDLLEPINPYGLSKLENGKLVPDDFLHEQYLLIEEKDKKILISGCSHKGIVNIVNWFKPDYLIGGFHFMKIDAESEDGQKVLIEKAEKLNSFTTKYFTCHCTGVPQFEFLKKYMRDNLQYLHAGSEINI